MSLKSIKPKKSLGQNFLIDKNIAQKTISLLDIKENDIIVEIGPGTGALTSLILERYSNPLIAVEIDHRAIEDLTQKYPKSVYKGFFLLHKDFRNFHFEDIKNILDFEVDNRTLKVIGNIPYYLSSEILFSLFESNLKINRAVMTIQKELAQRLVAKPASKDYGILTVALNMNAQCKIEFDVPPPCFYPPPNVMSSVINITFFENRQEHYSKLMKLVRVSFNQRRKMISNSLKSEISYIISDELSIDDRNRLNALITQRPERLLVEDFVFLHKLISNSKQK